MPERVQLFWGHCVLFPMFYFLRPISCVLFPVFYFLFSISCVLQATIHKALFSEVVTGKIHCLITNLYRQCASNGTLQFLSLCL